MSFKEVIQFAQENPVCSLATVDGTQPHVRGMMMWFADETGFYFSSAENKAMCRQLRANSKTELYFFKPGATHMEMRSMRVTGTFEFVEDKALLERLLKERPWINELRARFPRLSTAILRLAHGEARFWTLPDNLQEDKLPVIKF